MDGATGAALVLPVTIPEHPELTLTINAANKTRGQRFIACLSHEIFPGERLMEEYNRNNQPGVGVIASLDFLGLGPTTGETING